MVVKWYCKALPRPCKSAIQSRCGSIMKKILDTFAEGQTQIYTLVRLKNSQGLNNSKDSLKILKIA